VYLIPISLAGQPTVTDGPGLFALNDGYRDEYQALPDRLRTVNVMNCFFQSRQSISPAGHLETDPE
jgi:hypothetical protein